MDKTFKGVFSVLYTFYTPEGRIDRNAVHALIEHQLACGVNGIMVLGSAGEWAYLSAEEKKQVIECAVKCVNGRVPVIAGISAFGTDAAVENGKQAQDLGCDGLINLLPVNLPLRKAEIMKHYEALAGSLRLPILYYHYPECSHYDLTVEEYADILSIDGIVGTKSSKLDLKYFSKLISTLRERRLSKTILTGSSFGFVKAMSHGGDGVMCPHVNHWPEKAIGIYRHCLAGEWKQAKEDQIEMCALLGLYNGPQMTARNYYRYWQLATSGHFSSLARQKTNVIALHKEAVRQLGFPVTAIVKPPLSQLEEKQIAQVDRVMKGIGIPPILASLPGDCSFRPDLTLNEKKIQEADNNE